MTHFELIFVKNIRIVFLFFYSFLLLHLKTVAEVSLVHILNYDKLFILTCQRIQTLINGKPYDYNISNTISI